MKSLLISALLVFSFIFTISATDTGKAGIDLSPDIHSFTIDTIIVSHQHKEVVLSVYCEGVKQERKVTVLIDYQNPLVLKQSEASYKRFGYKISRISVKVSANVGGLPLNNLYNYTFIDQALEAANVK